MPYNKTILRKDESDSLLFKERPCMKSLSFASDGEKADLIFSLFTYWHTLEIASIIFEALLRTLYFLSHNI